MDRGDSMRSDLASFLFSNPFWQNDYLAQILLFICFCFQIQTAFDLPLQSLCIVHTCVGERLCDYAGLLLSALYLCHAYGFLMPNTIQLIKHTHKYFDVESTRCSIISQTECVIYDDEDIEQRQTRNGNNDQIMQKKI